MFEFLPILIIGAIIGVISLIFGSAYLAVRSKMDAKDSRRNMPDSVIIRRLLGYAKPYTGKFVLVLVIMLISVGYDLLAPIITGDIAELIKTEFALKDLYLRVGAEVGILVVSLVSTYLQTVILQKVGQKILSDLREDVFTHIESLSHEQLNNIPVGKLVTRVTNDTNGICMLFTNVLVTLVKNCMVIVGVFAAMLAKNFAMTLIVACFIPFIVLFAIIFQTFSRKAHRAVTDSRTDLNTFLSENLSGIKITQIFNREEEKMQSFLERSAHLRDAKNSG